jgi:hypothetical protein
MIGLVVERELFSWWVIGVASAFVVAVVLIFLLVWRRTR